MTMTAPPAAWSTMGTRIRLVIAMADGSTYLSRMGKLFATIRQAVAENRYLVSWHADERCEERGVTAWQLVHGLGEGKVISERPRTKPNPTIVVREILADGAEVEVVWSWLERSRKAKIVTVYFPE